MADWLDQAACAGYPTDWWFPSRGETNSRETLVALAICESCPVRDACLEYGIDEHHGIWGGRSERYRRRVRVQRDRRRRTAA